MALSMPGQFLVDDPSGTDIHVADFRIAPFAPRADQRAVPEVLSRA